MVYVNNFVFFENELDFISHCGQDPYGRGFLLRNCEIKKAALFPAAYKYEPDFDPHFRGSYIEVAYTSTINKMIGYLTQKRNEIDSDISKLRQIRT